jgi:hypothetical protein
MTNLSPLHRRCSTAYYSTDSLLAAPALAAALRVASDWVVPPFINRPSTRTGLVKLNIKNRLSSLADELEGRDETSI